MAHVELARNCDSGSWLLEGFAFVAHAVNGSDSIVTKSHGAHVELAAGGAEVGQEQVAGTGHVDRVCVGTVHII